MPKRTLIFLLLLTACSHNHVPNDATVVKIGAANPLTGSSAHLGKDNVNGIKLALNEANGKPVFLSGKPVYFKLVNEDDQGNSKTAILVAQKLVEEGVVGVIGDLTSGASISASKIYAKAGVPQISPSATAVGFTHQGYATTFRVIANDRQQGMALGNYAVHVLHAKRIAIIDDRTTYGQGLADQFEKTVMAQGGRIVDREYTTDQSADFMVTLSAIQAKAPDLVFFGGMDVQAAPMKRQMDELGIKAQFLCGDGCRTGDFIRLAGSDSDGVIASSPGLPLSRMPGGEKFKKSFEEKYGKIQLYAPYAYDATNVLINAMVRADSSDPSKYLPMLRTTDWKGVTGQIRFNAEGDVLNGPVTFYKVVHGVWQPEKPTGRIQ